MNTETTPAPRQGEDARTRTTRKETRGAQAAQAAQTEQAAQAAQAEHAAQAAQAEHAAQAAQAAQPAHAAHSPPARPSPIRFPPVALARLALGPQLDLDVSPRRSVTAVNVRRDDKEVFDALQAWWSVEAGRAVTQWEAFTLLLAAALDHPSVVVPEGVRARMR